MKACCEKGREGRRECPAQSGPPGRTVDVNVDGLAHFGMVPDVLEECGKRVFSFAFPALPRNPCPQTADARRVQKGWRLMMSQRAARKSSRTSSDRKAKKAVDGPLIAMVRVSSRVMNTSPNPTSRRSSDSVSPLARVEAIQHLPVRRHPRSVSRQA